MARRMTDDEIMDYTYNKLFGDLDNIESGSMFSDKEGATQGALARHFQLGIAQVGRIVRGECWMKGAGARMPTQAEGEAIVASMG